MFVHNVGLLENGVSVSSSNSGLGNCVHFYTNALAKGMNTSLLPYLWIKYQGQSGFSHLGWHQV